eukprot:487973-Rhodomonas_salina.1
MFWAESTYGFDGFLKSGSHHLPPGNLESGKSQKSDGRKSFMEIGNCDGTKSQLVHSCGTKINAAIST